MSSSNADRSGQKLSDVCTRCRRKHLKCDGDKVKPCTRCRKGGHQCAFVESRRGRRTRESPDPASDDTSSEPTFTERIRRPSGQSSASNNLLVPNDVLDSFYSTVYSSHPFLPPKAYLLAQMAEQDLSHLQVTLAYITAVYTGIGDRAYYRSQAEHRLDFANCPKTPFTVQALIFYAIGLNASTEPQKARYELGRAGDLGLALGMNQRDFASRQTGSAIFEESMRRTWWELNVVESLFTAMFDGQDRPSRFRFLPARVAPPRSDDDFPEFSPCLILASITNQSTWSLLAMSDEIMGVMPGRYSAGGMDDRAMLRKLMHVQIRAINDLSSRLAIDQSDRDKIEDLSRQMLQRYLSQLYSTPTTFSTPAPAIPTTGVFEPADPYTSHFGEPYGYHPPDTTYQRR